MRIGIFGGTFNPIHNIHLEMAKKAIKYKYLDKVIFVPSFRPYHKEYSNVDYEHRLNMIEIAIKSNSKFFVSDIEKYMNLSKSYTIDLLRIMKKIYNKDELFFIMGADSLLSIEKWNKFEDVLSLLKFIVFLRKGYESEDYILEKASYLRKKYNAKIDIITSLNTDVSSTKIREMVKYKKFGNIQIPKEVEEYIRKNKLYE